MGFYTSNRVGSIGNIQVEAAQGYQGEIGAQLALIESYQNDLAIFDNAIRTDFQEAAMVHEGAGVEEVFALQEGALSGFLDSIINFFKKLWEKIKGIFQGFMAKFDSVVMRDNKAFHDKYSKTVYAKDLSKMKAKYSAPKNLDMQFSTGSSIDLSVSAHFNDAEKKIENFDRDETICQILKSCKPNVNISEPKEFEKDFHEACFNDEEEQDGFSSIIHDIGNILVSKSPVEAIKKINASFDKTISDIIKEIDKSRTAINKLMPLKGEDTEGKNDISGIQHTFGGEDGGDGKTKSIGKNDGNTHGAGKTDVKNGSVKSIQKALNFVHMQAGAVQEATTKYTGGTLRETKFLVAQARRIFAGAVAHNPKSVKESAVLEAAMQEAAEYEVMSSFEMY